MTFGLVTDDVPLLSIATSVNDPVFLTKHVFWFNRGSRFLRPGSLMDIS